MSATITPTVRKERIEDYDEFVDGMVHIDHLREQAGTAERVERALPGSIVKFRQSHQNVAFYDTWDPGMDLSRAAQLTRDYASDSGFLVQIDEILIDPSMVFMVGRVWV